MAIIQLEYFVRFQFYSIDKMEIVSGGCLRWERMNEWTDSVTEAKVKGRYGKKTWFNSAFNFSSTQDKWIWLNRRTSENKKSAKKPKPTNESIRNWAREVKPKQTQQIACKQRTQKQYRQETTKQK